MDELNVNHQLCIFHLYKMIGDKLYRLTRSKKITKDEKFKLKKYFKEIMRNIQHIQTMKQQKQIK